MPIIVQVGAGMQKIRKHKQNINAVRDKLKLRDHAKITTNPAISFVVYNVIPLLIGPSALALIISVMYHVGEGHRPCPFLVTGNGHGRVAEP